VVRDSTNIVFVEVTNVNADKGLILFKKLKDLKGKHPTDEIKHNIGNRGHHEREWKNVRAWAEVGKRAVFFHNGQASETCTGTYWYQCYKEQNDWWGMSHAEPFRLRTFYGDPEKLAAAVSDIVDNKEVIVTCLADGNKNDLHLRKGKLQRLKASLKRLDYNVKRDFVAFGGDGEDIPEFKTTVLLAESSRDWKFLPAAQVGAGNGWTAADYDDKTWRTGKAPIGYGEEELKKREGTLVAEQFVPFYFRRAVNVPRLTYSRRKASSSG
jgi:hypothetical protein